MTLAPDWVTGAGTCNSDWLAVWWHSVLHFVGTLKNQLRSSRQYCKLSRLLSSICRQNHMQSCENVPEKSNASNEKSQNLVESLPYVFATECSESSLALKTQYPRQCCVYLGVGAPAEWGSSGGPLASCFGVLGCSSWSALEQHLGSMRTS